MMGWDTIDNLIKKCQFLVNRCCLCCCDGESMDHLLLHCKFSHALWCEVFVVFGIQWVMPRLVKSFFFIWRNWFGKHLSIIWNVVPACLMWLVWQERNARIFEDKARTLEHLKCLLFRTLFLWARIWGCTNCTAVADFLVSISFSSWSSCICFIVQSVHHREHGVQFFSIKVLLPIKKKEYFICKYINTSRFITWSRHLHVHTLFECHLV